MKQLVEKTEDQAQAVVARRGGRRRRLRGRFGALAFAVALLGSVAGGLAAAPMASAGTFGQQIEITTGTANSVTVCGLNQYKNRVCHGWDTPNPSTLLAGWWWQGDVMIFYYYGSNETGYWTTQTYPVLPQAALDVSFIYHQ